MDKLKSEENYNKILPLVQDFCAKKLNKKYFKEGEGLLKKLNRKRTKPLATGKPEIWAAGVIHALASLNFLFDKSNEHYLTTDEINSYFETNKSTVTAKSRIICDLLKLSRFDNAMARFMQEMENSLMDSFVMVDDNLVPISSLPPEYQLIVRNARANGEDVSFSTS